MINGMILLCCGLTLMYVSGLKKQIGDLDGKVDSLRRIIANSISGAGLEEDE